MTKKLNLILYYISLVIAFTFGISFILCGSIILISNTEVMNIFGIVVMLAGVFLIELSIKK